MDPMNQGWGRTGRLYLLFSFYEFLFLTKGLEGTSFSYHQYQLKLYISAPMYQVFSCPNELLPDKMALAPIAEELRKSLLYTLAIKFQGHSFEGTLLFFKQRIMSLTKSL